MTMAHPLKSVRLGRRAATAFALVFVCALFGMLEGLRAQSPVAPPENAPPPKTLQLSLDEAVRLGTLNNTGLRGRLLDHLVERARIQEAKGAFDHTFFTSISVGQNEAIFPQIFPTGNVGPDGQPEFFQTIVNDASLSANLRTGVRGLFVTGATYELSMNSNYVDREAGGLVNPSFNTTTRLQVTQPLLRAAWEQYNLTPVRQARYAEGQSRERFRRDVQQTILDVHRAYWELVFTRLDLKVKQNSLQLAEKLLEINRVKVRTGVFAPIEIASAESGVANRITDVQVAENAVEEAQDRLRRLILPFDFPVDWEVAILTIDTADDTRYEVPGLQSAIESALNDRPDLGEQRLRIKSADLGVARADNDLLPRLDLTGSMQWVGLNTNFGPTIPESFGPNGAETWSVGLNLEIPLGNQTARGRLVQERLQRDRVLLDFRDLRVSTMEQVRAAHRKVELSVRTIASRQRAESLKRQELENEQIKLENKVSTNFQVLQVQEDLALRQSELNRARVDYRIAIAELAFAMGSSPGVLKWPTNKSR
jgi:outer membrane protein